jgi:predicted dehydrogenase
MAKKKGPITVGVIGLGRAGWDIHVRRIRDRKDFKVVAVAEPDPERRKQAEDELGAKSFETIDELLAGSRAELIVVATASVDHVPHSIKALEAGRHVLVEKPMAGTFMDADRLMAVVRKSDKVFTVHQSARWAPEFAFVRGLVEGGRLGQVYFIRRGAYSYGRRNDWQRLAKYHGGTMNNNGVHLLDQCRLLMGAPIVDVFGDLQMVLSPGDTDDCMKVVMRGANGRVIDCEVYDACSAPMPSWVILGTRGSAVIQGKEARIRYLKGELPPLEINDRPLVPGRRYGIIGQGREPLEWVEETVEPTADPGHSFYDLLQKAIREGAPPPVDPEICYEVAQVIERARTKLTKRL